MVNIAACNHFSVRNVRDSIGKIIYYGQQIVCELLNIKDRKTEFKRTHNQVHGHYGQDQYLQICRDKIT